MIKTRTVQETIREHLGRRTRQCVVIALIGWVVFTACIFVHAIPLPIMVGAFIAVIASMLALLLTVRCPRCRARLPQVGIAELWLPSNAVKLTHCPTCGAHLNQPLDNPRD